MILTQAVLNEVKAAYLSGYEKGYVDGNQAAVEAKVSKFIDAHTKPWAGLTEEEVGDAAYESNLLDDYPEKFVALIEAKLKEKNG
jgi:hypothetical protein